MHIKFGACQKVKYTMFASVSYPCKAQQKCNALHLEY